MGTPLKNPPVYFTLAQVKFNPVLTLGEYLPAIQEAFRRAGFPDFQKHRGFAIKVTMENGMAKPAPQPQQLYVFGDADRKHSFLLDSGSLTFQSTDYGQFESFSKKFEEGLDRVHQAVSLAYIERVGLRYLDCVAALTPDDKLQDYVVECALGLRDVLGGKPAHSYCETLTEIEGVKLLSRVFTHQGPLGFPPDIGAGVPLLLQRRFQGPAKLHAVLDNDGFVERREGFSIGTVHKHLDDIHKVIGKAFKDVTTKHAREMWDKQS